MGKKYPEIVIVDYDVGNIFSVMRACEWLGVNIFVTSDPKKICSADR